MLWELEDVAVSRLIALLLIIVKMLAAPFFCISMQNMLIILKSFSSKKNNLLSSSIGEGKAPLLLQTKHKGQNFVLFSRNRSMPGPIYLIYDMLDASGYIQEIDKGLSSTDLMNGNPCPWLIQIVLVDGQFYWLQSCYIYTHTRKSFQ